MTKADKLLIEFKQAKKSYLWSDPVNLLKVLGFEQFEGSGSRVRFIKDDLQIRLHKPHPQKEIKAYVIKQVKETLIAEGLL
jgi:predicted RNA binding protein YcfA (HicA-like mRNA interferase family)